MFRLTTIRSIATVLIITFLMLVVFPVQEKAKADTVETLQTLSVVFGAAAAVLFLISFAMKDKKDKSEEEGIEDNKSNASLIKMDDNFRSHLVKTNQPPKVNMFLNVENRALDHLNYINLESDYTVKVGVAYGF